MTSEAMFVQQLLGRGAGEARMEDSWRFILEEMPARRDRRDALLVLRDAGVVPAPGRGVDAVERRAGARAAGALTH